MISNGPDRTLIAAAFGSRWGSEAAPISLTSQVFYTVSPTALHVGCISFGWTARKRWFRLCGFRRHVVSDLTVPTTQGRGLEQGCSGKDGSQS